MINRSSILVLIRQALEDDEEVDEFLVGLGDRELIKMVFHSPIGKEDNLRLSSNGCELLKKSFETYEQRLGDDYQLTARDLLFLKENCSFPYYISVKAKMLILFEKELALRVKIAGGQLSLLI